MSEVKIGIVSTRSPMAYNANVAKDRIASALDEALAHFAPRGVKQLTIVIESMRGVLHVAHEEAFERGWKTEVIPHKDHPIPAFHPSMISIVGRDWGESSSSFVAAIDGIIEIGGDRISRLETLEAGEKEKPVFIHPLLMFSLLPEAA